MPPARFLQGCPAACAEEGRRLWPQQVSGNKAGYLKDCGTALSGSLWI
ncbi:MAG: hypothetical protein Q4A62_06385 [Eikenella sp.]|nr:hypothetical protein [Eikenella sp.]